MTAPTPSPEIPADIRALIEAERAALTAPLREQVERLTTAANAHESCKESWRECLPPGHDCMFGPNIARHWKARAERAEAEVARLSAALVNGVQRLVEEGNAKIPKQFRTLESPDQIGDAFRFAERENARLRAALQPYRHCRHGCVDCFCVREAARALAPEGGPGKEAPREV